MLSLRNLSRATILVLALASVAARAGAQCPDGAPPPCSRPAAAPAMSVAVLTFQSRSRDANDVYLAEGLADDIASRVGQREEAATVIRSMGDAADSWYYLRSPAYDALRGIPEFDSYVERARARALWTAKPSR